jgi:hypothetical protein
MTASSTDPHRSEIPPSQGAGEQGIGLAGAWCRVVVEMQAENDKRAREEITGRLSDLIDRMPEITREELWVEAARLQLLALNI